MLTHKHKGSMISCLLIFSFYINDNYESVKKKSSFRVHWNSRWINPSSLHVPFWLRRCGRINLSSSVCYGKSGGVYFCCLRNRGAIICWAAFTRFGRTRSWSTGRPVGYNHSILTGMESTWLIGIRPRIAIRVTSGCSSRAIMWWAAFTISGRTRSWSTGHPVGVNLSILTGMENTWLIGIPPRIFIRATSGCSDRRTYWAACIREVNFFTETK